MNLKEVFVCVCKVVQFELLSLSPLVLRLLELIRKYPASKQGLMPTSRQAWAPGAEQTPCCLQLVEVRNASVRDPQVLGTGPSTERCWSPLRKCRWEPGSIARLSMLCLTPEPVRVI